MPLTIAICDDNEEQISVLRQLLGEWAEDKPFALDIDEYVSAESFLFSYPDNPCGLLLLDIEKTARKRGYAAYCFCDGVFRIYERRVRGRGAPLSA